MRVIHVVPHIHREASGPSYSVVQLCQSLNENNIDISLCVLDEGQHSNESGFIKYFPDRRFPRRLGRCPEMYSWLEKSVSNHEADIVHSHSLWMMPNVYPGWVTRGKDIPLIISPRGTLSKWALNNSKWTKKLFWAAFQYNAIEHAKCFHATAESEYKDIRNAGFDQPVAILPNGVFMPNIKAVEGSSLGRRRLLFLGRIHPVKGIDMLLKAWAAVSPKYDDWELQVIGPCDRGYLDKMREMATELKLNRVSFPGPLYGEDKARAYQEADIYVLPTHSENFGMTVAEALASGTPAIVTEGAPWPGLESHNAGWWIERTLDSLVACLENAMALSPDALSAMGARGRMWMANEYSWGSIGEKMLKTYAWLQKEAADSSKPDWVILD